MEEVRCQIVAETSCDPLLLVHLGIRQQAMKSRILRVELMCTSGVEHLKRWRYLVVHFQFRFRSSSPFHPARFGDLCEERRSRGRHGERRRGLIRNKRSTQSVLLLGRRGEEGEITAYIYHRKQDVSSSGCLLSPV